MNLEDLEHFRRALEVVDAKHSGYLLTERPEDDAVFQLWGRLCDNEQLPDVYARVEGETACVRLDMAPTGKPLGEPALQQAIVLLFGAETLATHRKLLVEPERHGLSADEIDLYYRRVGQARPVMWIGSKTVPADRAAGVAEQLAKLARAALEEDDGAIN